MNNIDEMLDDELVVLRDSEGNEIEFIEIAGIKLRDSFYVILQPVELFDGMNEDEAIVFEYTKVDGVEDNYKFVDEDEIIDEVFEEYNRLLAEAIAEGDME